MFRAKSAFCRSGQTSKPRCKTSCKVNSPGLAVVDIIIFYEIVYDALFGFITATFPGDVVIVEDSGEDSLVEEATIMATHPWLCVHQYSSHHWLPSSNGSASVADVKVILPTCSCLPQPSIIVM